MFLLEQRVFRHAPRISQEPTAPHAFNLNGLEMSVPRITSASKIAENVVSGFCKAQQEETASENLWTSAGLSTAEGKAVQLAVDLGVPCFL